VARWSITIAACIAVLAAIVFFWLRSPATRTPGPSPDVAAPPTPTPGIPDDLTPEDTTAPIQLVDVTPTTGIRFRHTDGSSGMRYVVEAFSAGLATFDFDGDGLLDIYFPNGAPLPGSSIDPPPRHALYRNLGDWTFRDVTQEAGVVCTAYGLGVTIGDYNNDGWPDIYLSNFGPNILFRNNGDGTFRSVTESAGVARGDLLGAGTSFLDIEGDGDLDLYVGNYITYDCDDHVPVVIDGIPSYPSPRDYEPLPDTLYRNDGDDSFTDVSVESGIAAHAGRAMGMVCADYDRDGDTDVFVCNDVQENYLFQNDGQGVFVEVARLAGAAYNGNGQVLANMAVDVGDYNNDGWLDFFTTNYQGQVPVLFHNLGNGLLDDVTARTGAASGCHIHVNWGCGFVDLDNDGHLDLFIGNGHTEDNIELRMTSAVYKARCVVLRNVGGKFENVSERVGDGLQRELAARGVALDDMDNDGDVDVVILASREGPMILRNMLVESRSDNHWLDVELHGVLSNRDGVGSRVTVTAGDLTLVDEVHSGRGYQGHSGSRLHFGLGPRDHVDRIEVAWLGGETEVIEDVPADRLVRIVERGRRGMGSAK
jgi:hypothetical protein